MTPAETTVARADIEGALAAISPYVRRTPVIEVPGDEFGVDARLDATLVIKLEFMQRSGAFKARGATHYVATQPIADTGIVAASGGKGGVRDRAGEQVFVGAAVGQVAIQAVGVIRQLV